MFCSPHRHRLWRCHAVGVVDATDGVLNSASKALILFSEVDPIVWKSRAISWELIYWTLGTFIRFTGGDDHKLGAVPKHF